MQLEVRDIKKSFGTKEVLHGISFVVSSARTMGFLGRNGAGKSTTFRCLMDVFRPDSGSFLLDGQRFKPGTLKIGYLPEERGMYQKNEVQSQLIYFARLRGASAKEARRTAEYWVDYFQLGEFKKKNLETLSKGNQQKIQIAQSFLNEPDILILDEPFSGLDPINAQIFKDAIAAFVKQGKLVIFSSHQMGYVEEICDDVTLIHEGRILLSGDLNKLKLTEGKNKMFLSTLEPPAPDFLQALGLAFPQMSLEAVESGLILDTGSRVSQHELMSWLSQQPVAIRSFGIYEPSLNDIFIKRAGDRA
jgi:ABC-2 type transport system ATP-binding protein